MKKKIQNELNELNKTNGGKICIYLLTLDNQKNIGFLSAHVLVSIFMHNTFIQT